MAKVKPDHSLPGRVYNLTEAQKAAEMQCSTSFLQKDRMKPKPAVDYKRFGGLIRYASDLPA